MGIFDFYLLQNWVVRWWFDLRFRFLWLLLLLRVSSVGQTGLRRVRVFKCCAFFHVQMRDGVGHGVRLAVDAPCAFLFDVVGRIVAYLLGDGRVLVEGHYVYSWRIFFFQCSPSTLFLSKNGTTAFFFLLDVNKKLNIPICLPFGKNYSTETSSSQTSSSQIARCVLKNSKNMPTTMP